MSSRLVVAARDERGSIVSLLALAGMFLVMLAVLLHFVVTGHVRHVVGLHADAGALAASAFDGSETAGNQRVQTGLTNETGWIESFSVTTQRGAEWTTVRVSVEVIDLASFMDTTMVVERRVPTEAVPSS